MKVKLRKYNEIPMAGVIPGGSTPELNKTGDWRTQRPKIDKETCIDCLQCWAYCPDSAINVKEDKMEGFDYDYCKGCGICAEICPVDAIDMEPEGG
jgi:pyruvate ferredoxin oxidoreductase delta subunit